MRAGPAAGALGALFLSSAAMATTGTISPRNVATPPKADFAFVTLATARTLNDEARRQRLPPLPLPDDSLMAIFDSRGRYEAIPCDQIQAEMHILTLKRQDPAYQPLTGQIDARLLQYFLADEACRGGYGQSPE